MLNKKVWDGRPLVVLLQYDSERFLGKANRKIIIYVSIDL